MGYRGAASLEVTPGGRLIDSPDFPSDWKASAIEGISLLDARRKEEGIDGHSSRPQL